MREATFIEEWLDERWQQGLQLGLQQGLQQGLAQGKALGKRQTAQAILRRILWRRFGILPLSLDAKLGDLTAEQAESLVDAALDAPDLDAFQAALLDQTRRAPMALSSIGKN